MQDFLFGKTRAQEAAPEPYMLYNKEQADQKLTPNSETLRDIEYFRSMYPIRVKSLQIVVEEVFNELDYESSPIYDEYPDRMLVEKLHQKIRDRIKDDHPEDGMEKWETGETWKNPAMQAQPMQDQVMQNQPMQNQPMQNQPMQEQAVQNQPPQDTESVEIQESMPHMPHGPMYIVQSFSTDDGSYKTWEMEEGEIVERQERPSRMGPPPPPPRPWGPPPPPHPWGPPPPPPRPWGPPPPPPRPWGPPPPPPRPWGPPPPPPHPWGPPPPPRPWGPPPPPRPWGPPPPSRVDLDDIIRLLLFGEMQKRRCNGRNCR